MKYIKTFENHQSKEIGNRPDIKDTIKNLKKLPKELKDVAISLIQTSKSFNPPIVLTSAKNGKVTNLNLHPDLEKKIKDGGYPSGFSMGVDKDGYFIHTHRARSKSYESPDMIKVSDMKFIDSTG